jgi:hypothetical protein
VFVSSGYIVFHIFNPKGIALTAFLLSFALGGCPVYHGNSYNGPVVKDCAAYLEHGTFVSGSIARHRSVNEDDYSQARIFYKVCFCSTSFSLHCCYIDCL